jgi:hypothetical protein
MQSLTFAGFAAVLVITGVDLERTTRHAAHIHVAFPDVILAAFDLQRTILKGKKKCRMFAFD